MKMTANYPSGVIVQNPTDKKVFLIADHLRQGSNLKI
jgi:hypothetical protein